MNGIRSLFKLIFCLCMLGTICACADRSRIDVDWHRTDLTDGLLARWLLVAPSPSGFMRTAVDRQWQPLAAQPGYLTEQARLIYAMAIGYEVTKDKRYLNAATRGADFMLTHFKDPLHGGFYLRVDMNGKVISSAKNTYAHAFALFALSNVARVTGDEHYRTAALQTWQDIDTGLRHPGGGFYGELPRNFARPADGANSALSQNPLMHMFEALLALHDATQSPIAQKGAKNLADFVVYRLLVGTADGGAYIPEWYNHGWQPLPNREKGGYVDLGHQFEWSHMLMAADRHGLAGVYEPTARRLLQFAVKTGYDEAEGGIYTKMYPDGTVEHDKFWWQQAEGLRAFMAAATSTGQQDMWRRYEQTLRFVQTQFVDTKNGGWYPRARKQCGGCPDDQPDPYHMVGLHNMALGLAVDLRK